MTPDTAPQTLIVPSDLSGLRLDVFLQHSLSVYSRSHFQKLITGGSITVNGRTAQKRRLLLAGDCVAIAGMGAAGSAVDLAPAAIPLAILYEDDCLIAIDKPAGLVVHPGSGNRDNTLVNALLHHRGAALSSGSHPERPGIVHRLDKDTSGVLLVAKTDPAHAALAEAFASRTVKKSYLGLCLGAPRKVSGAIDMPLARSKKDTTRYIADPEGKLSLTDFKLLCREQGITLIRFMPRTGRTHQIRVHCAECGFPILGDILYGGGKARLPQVAPENRAFAVSMLKCFARHALHARSITIIHPFTKKELTVRAPLPADFQSALLLIRRRRLRRRAAGPGCGPAAGTGKNFDVVDRVMPFRA